jgi:hypothetical protein
VRARRLLPVLLLTGCEAITTSEVGPALDAGLDAGPEPLVPAPACAAPGATVHDLAPVLRLREEGTFTAILEWTRESRDALATTRDSDPDTGWLPTPGEAALAELDLAPFTGRPIAVRAIEMEWAGPAPEVEVRVRDACGGGLVARSRGSARVALSDVCGSCIELAVRAETGARLVSLGVESADGAIALPPLVAAPPAVPAISHRDLGVIEGFYGQPWDWDERARMVDVLGRAGLGLYIYAPKDDRLHRAEWRTPYPADFVARFGELAALAEARGVRAVIALSPFIDFDPGAASDLDAIVAKLRAFVEAGAGGIALFADDIEFDSDRPIDGALGRVHVDAVNAVLAALRDTEPDVRMWFVGTVYSDERLATWASGADYLRALRGLDPGVSVLWTGPGTFSPSLAGSDLVAASELVGRPVAIWDNHWANDGGDAVFGRILLGTYGARDRDLLTVPRSVVNNPMIQGSLSRLAVGTFAAWAADPTLDAAGMRARSAAAELAFGGGAGDDALLVRLMETLDGSNAGEPSDRILAAVLGRITAALTAGEAPATDDVVLALDRLASARTLASELRHSRVGADLVDELAFPLAKVSAGAELGLLALERVAVVLAGENVDEHDARLRDVRRAFPRVSRFRWMDLALDSLADAAEAFSPADLRGRPTLGMLPAACRVGEPLELSSVEVPGLTVSGLPGATVGAERIVWTAPHPGRYEAVLVAAPSAEGSGWTARTVSLVCRP